MTDHENQDSTPATPQSGAQQGGKKGVPKDQRRPFTPDPSGRAKRGSEFRDADLFDAPVEDPDDIIPD
jgi:hypothetical protein